MLFLLSPAKALDFEPSEPALPHSQPQFVPQAAELIGILKQLSPPQVARLMSLSDALSALNVARYQAWSPKFTRKNAKQAVLAFNGDAYQGLAAGTLALEDLNWLQQHLCILSGLYGVLRPLDYLQPYRLEMGTQLPNARGKNLYEFWGSRISEHLNARLKSEVAPVLVNLASQEYFKAVDLKILKARVIDCV
ncbi:MAG TPA: peroxide stress protein YaaA, partial [Rhodoferax sp.]|nr:peroxide stress protein YaaA [Rhodoferax sp.]